MVAPKMCITLLQMLRLKSLICSPIEKGLGPNPSLVLS